MQESNVGPQSPENFRVGRDFLFSKQNCQGHKVNTTQDYDMSTFILEESSTATAPSSGRRLLGPHRQEFPYSSSPHQA